MLSDLSSSKRGDPKISGIVTKMYLIYLYKFETLVPLQSTAPVTGRSDPCSAATAGNIVKNLQQKCFQEPPAILIESLQRQQNASLSKPATSVGTKKNRKERGRVSRGGGTSTSFCF
jgi:hypothetical protein